VEYIAIGVLLIDSPIRMWNRSTLDITYYDLPELPAETNEDNPVPRVIQEELSIQIPNEDIESIGKLNHDQMVAFNTIMNAIDHNQSQVLFVDGPGGTGKAFLYRALMATLRNRGKIVLATASSGIATTLLPGGRLHTPDLIYLLMYNQIPSAI